MQLRRLRAPLRQHTHSQCSARTFPLRQVVRLASSSSRPQPASTSSSSSRVLGYGDPVMDVLASVPPDYLSSNRMEPGGCIPIDVHELQATMRHVGETTQLLRIPGGSAANVMRGLAKISAGSLMCTFMGMAGADATAASYRQQMQDAGVRPLLLESPTQAPTATSICLITPDGQRTMRTCLGAALELNQPAQLPPGWREAAGQLLHCEGYSLYCPELTRHIMAEAKASGATVSIDLASFEVVERCGGTLQALLQDGLLDVVFANEQECAAVGRLLGVAAGEGDGMVEEVQQRLLQWCSVVVVSLGADGCVARGADGQVGRAPACLVPVQDTVAAGDYFSSGFLYGYLQGVPLQLCAVFGCAAGAEAVQARGAAVSEAAWAQLRVELAGLIDQQRPHQHQQQQLLQLQQKQQQEELESERRHKVVQHTKAARKAVGASLVRSQQPVSASA